jgi:hypothetical protein
MKKLSANAQRKRKHKINVDSIRKRFKEPAAVEPDLGWPQLGPLIAKIPTGSVMALFSLFALTLLLLITAIFNPWQVQISGSNLVCRPTASDLQTKAPAFNLQASLKAQKTETLRANISKIVKNTPMEKMVGEIAKTDRPVAAFIVGIAMKESKFGKFSPKKDGKDCYNYWGYRGKENTTKSGYSCFSSPSHAIEVVGSKIASMVKNGAKTPASMISWKCGSSCAGHDPASVTKWISDVAINYYQLNPKQTVARNKS